jgi:Leucine-rich repeat (LRR) protein
MFPFLLIFLLGLISLQGQLNSTWSTELLADNAAFSLNLQVLYDLYTSTHGELTNLTSIDLASNYLGGTLPASIWGLSNLSSLEISYNWLSGTLSSAVQNLKNLTWLDTFNNTFRNWQFRKSTHFKCSI